MQLLNQTKSSYKKLNDTHKLYIWYLIITLLAWLISYSPPGGEISRTLVEYAQRYEPIVSISTSVSQFFSQALGSVLAAYFAILAIQIVLGKNSGRLIYLVLGAVIGLAGGAGRGLATYTWSSTCALIVVSQFEWLGGAYLVTAADKLEFNIPKIVFGFLLISLSLILISLILFN